VALEHKIAFLIDCENVSPKSIEGEIEALSKYLNVYNFFPSTVITSASHE
jgi:hypothetical protein